MAYANANAVPYVAIVGSNELAEGKVTLKNMETGEQSTKGSDPFVSFFSCAAKKLKQHTDNSNVTESFFISDAKIPVLSAFTNRFALQNCCNLCFPKKG